MKPRNLNTEFKLGTVGKFTKLTQKTPVSELLMCCTSDDTGKQVYHYSSDLSLLFSQKRLDKLGVDSLSSFLDTLVPHSDSLASLRSNCSDEELMAVIKSRHIQSPAELLSWSKFLDKSQQEIKRLHREQVEKLKKSKDNSEDEVEPKSD